MIVTTHTRLRDKRPLQPQKVGTVALLSARVPGYLSSNIWMSGLVCGGQSVVQMLGRTYGL